MADDLILQKLSARFKLLGSLPHLRICHCLALECLTARELAGRLGIKLAALERLLAPLVAEDLVFSERDGRYGATRAVLRDLGDFLNPARASGQLEYPRPDCCWPHSA